MDLLQKFTDHTRCFSAGQFLNNLECGQNIFCNRSFHALAAAELEKGEKCPPALASERRAA
jgi:hypothetical protein